MNKLTKSILSFSFFTFSFSFFTLLCSAQTSVLYGMTNAGGISVVGAIIKFNPTTNAEDTVYGFGSGYHGANPWGNLVFYTGNRLFYGMTYQGGKSDSGAIISFNPTTNIEDTLHSFRRGDDDGYYPYGNLVYCPADGLFYGMTSQGGSLDFGTIISFNPLTNTEDTVHSFGRGDDGREPWGSLIYYPSNESFYSMTQWGGSLNKGAIISFNPSTNIEDTVHSFGRGVDGQRPFGNLIFCPVNGLFYGMTCQGGRFFAGAIISFNPITNTEDTAYSFGGKVDDGEGPFGTLVFCPANGLYYGMTRTGGSVGYGTIISFNPITNVEDTVHSFGRGVDGQNPYGSLVYYPGNGLFYGMTSQGGKYSEGVIISFNPLTNTEDTVHNLGYGDDGANPFGDFVLYTPCTLSTSVSVIHNLLCNGGDTGSAHATATGGVAPLTYSWAPGGGTKDTATGLTAGSYTVTIKDNNGCSATSSISITQPAVLHIMPDSIIGAPCTSSAWVNVSGGTSPYTYLWTNAKTTDSISNLCIGSYCCMVTDANGCKDSVCILILWTGIENIVSNTNQVSVYPNPNNGVFTLFCHPAVIAGSQLEIYNALGEKIYSQSNIKNSPFNIDLSSQPNGVYLYRVIANDGSIIGEGKLIIQK